MKKIINDFMLHCNLFNLVTLLKLLLGNIMEFIFFCIIVNDFLNRQALQCLIKCTILAKDKFLITCEAVLCISSFVNNTIL